MKNVFFLLYFAKADILEEFNKNVIQPVSKERLFKLTWNPKGRPPYCFKSRFQYVTVVEYWENGIKVFFGAKQNNNGTIRIIDNGVYNEELIYTFNTSGMNFIYPISLYIQQICFLFDHKRDLMSWRLSKFSIGLSLKRKS